MKARCLLSLYFYNCLIEQKFGMNAVNSYYDPVLFFTVEKITLQKISDKNIVGKTIA